MGKFYVVLEHYNDNPGHDYIIFESAKEEKALDFCAKYAAKHDDGNKWYTVDEIYKF